MMQTEGGTQHVPLQEVEASYRRVAADVRMLSTFQLRWAARRAVRRAANSSAVHDLVTLRAITDEFTYRGMEMPR